MPIETFVGLPVEVEAVQFVGGKENVREIRDWILASYGWAHDTAVFVTKGMAQGPQAWRYIKNDASWPEAAVAAVYDSEIHMCWLPVQVGQWIVKGPKGEFYPCDADVFEGKYRKKERATA